MFPSQSRTDHCNDEVALISLTRWSHNHIRDVFESTSEEECIQAIQKTFSKDIEATINGWQAQFDDIVQSVLTMRRESKHGLKVEWKQSVEVSQDSSNKVISSSLQRFDMKIIFLGCLDWDVRRSICYSWYPQKKRPRRAALGI